MFAENDYFLTMDCQLYDNKTCSWAHNWGSDELVRKRIEGGVTYCAWSKNRKNNNHLSVCFKFNDKDSMENYEKQIQSVIKEKHDTWTKIGDLSSLEKNRWHILKECMLDLDMSGVLNQTDDIFWFAKHKVDDRDKWVNSAVEATNMGVWKNVRWWGLMQKQEDNE